MKIYTNLADIKAPFADSDITVSRRLYYICKVPIKFHDKLTAHFLSLGNGKSYFKTF